MFDFMRNQINAKRCRSAWDKGVRLYALELVDSLEERAQYEGRNPADVVEVTAWAQNGAENWRAYSYGGLALIYDGDIAERLCTASELKKTRNGERRPNSIETWLDVQTRALFQAAALVRLAYLAAQQIMKGGKTA